MPKMEATTIWESWEGTKAQGGIASLNHYSKGAVCEWLFKIMCGINVSDENRFEIKPISGGTIAYAKTEYDSVYGKVASGWKRTARGYNYSITVPANCTAQIVLPNGTTQEVGAGEYIFEV